MTEQAFYDYVLSLLVKKNYSSGDMNQQLTRLKEKLSTIGTSFKLFDRQPLPQ
ncbi:hypothetical protein Rin_00004790 [Candidatus Regiella insecticola 5.15]|uniref:Uncharacterized protein n=1 Tax=Candidatus Regiella insecticola 5.15 TaxID=1005043 RepID=G2GXI7_9ENTR|nr:hypothetical protein [Candidatus Regiella insecticola]EGY29549.1 hypothetical protein Rin_00004790 [Candidatus Regiella insecticola 5.15]